MADPDDIRAWQRLSERVTTSGRLQEPDPPGSPRSACATSSIWRCPTTPRRCPMPTGAFAAQGIGYTHIPVPFAAPEEAHYQAFVAALEAAEGPVHVHCIVNWRVSAFFYRYHRDACGMAEPEARALMERQWSPETSDYPGAPAWAALHRGSRSADGLPRPAHRRHRRLERDRPASPRETVASRGGAGLADRAAPGPARRGGRAGWARTTAGFAADVADQGRSSTAPSTRAAAVRRRSTACSANAGLTGGFTPASSSIRRVFEQTMAVNLMARVLGDPARPRRHDRGEEGRDPGHRLDGLERGMAMNPAYVAEQARRARPDPRDRGRMARARGPRQLRGPRLHPHRRARPHPARAAGKIAGRVPQRAHGHARWSWPKSPRSCSATRRAMSPGRTGRSTAACSAR